MHLPRQQIINAALAGTRPAQIARDTGVSVYSVYATLSAARKAGINVPRFNGGGLARVRLGQELRFMLPPDIAAELLTQADALNMRPAELARQLITTICEDRMIPAVLDVEGPDG